MTFGLIARAELSRGLGVLTSALYRHIPPDKTLVVDMSGHNGGFAQDFSAYPGATIRPYGSENDRTLGEWMEGLDVIYTAETAYWPRLFDIARFLGVRTILHAMPELAPWGIDDSLPRPDLFALPTTYRWDAIPEPKVLLPVPVDRERLKFRPRHHADVFLHIVGHKAMLDRNGTKTLLQALPFVRNFCRLVIRTQDTQEPLLYRIPKSRVMVEVVTEDYPDYAMPYDEADVLVMPRRYAGLCLPAQEAMSCGLALLMTGCPPNQDWLHPEGHIAVSRTRPAEMKGGLVDVHAADPKHLAERMDNLIENPELVARMSLHSDEWAGRHSWEAWTPRYRELLLD